MRKGPFALLFSSLLACGGGSSGTDDSSATGGEQDWVVQSAFDRAFTVVKGVDYLPFQYKVDGCYARALYMSMELAAQGMESNAVFAFAQQGTVLQVGPIRWGYHVAPMLEVGKDADHLVDMVIDPALSTKPLTEDQWVGAMGYQPDDANHPYMLIVPGSDYAPYEATHDIEHMQKDTPDFAHLPPFKASDVQSACGVMWSYIAIEPGSDQATIDAKHEKLIARSNDLVAKLADANKLTADIVFDEPTCRAGSH